MTVTTPRTLHLGPPWASRRNRRRLRGSLRGSIARSTGAETGFGVLVAVIVLGVVLALLANILFATAVDNVSTTSRAIQQNQALQSAETGVDIAYQRISAVTTVKSVPCSSTAVSGTLWSVPHASTYNVTFAYYSTLTGSGTKLTCTQLTAGTATPQSVQVTSVGKDLKQSTKMASLANISLSGGTTSLFADSVYVHGTLDIGNGVTFTAKTSTKGIYVAGNLVCTHGGKAYGNVIVTGTFSAKGTCGITGTVTIIGAVTMTSGGSPKIATGTKATGHKRALTSTHSTITITASGSTVGNMYAYGSASVPSGWTAHGTITATDHSLTTPPALTFPTVKWTPTGWAALGFTTATTNTCTAAGLYAKLKAMHTATKPLAIYTTCKVTMTTIASTSKYYLKKSLAIFSTAGFAMAGSSRFIKTTSLATTSATAIDLYLFVPTDKATGTAVSCASTNGNMAFTNGADATKKIDTLIYTPCSITMSGSYTMSGQIYADKALSVSGGMSYGGGLTVPGATGATPTPKRSPTLGIVYEREYS